MNYATNVSSSFSFWIVLEGLGHYFAIFFLFLVVSRRIREKKLPNVICPGRETDQMRSDRDRQHHACTGTALRTHRRVLINAVTKSHRG